MELESQIHNVFGWSMNRKNHIGPHQPFPRSTDDPQRFKPTQPANDPNRFYLTRFRLFCSVFFFISIEFAFFFFWSRFSCLVPVAFDFDFFGSFLVGFSVLFFLFQFGQLLDSVLVYSLFRFGYIFQFLFFFCFVMVMFFWFRFVLVGLV